MKRPNKAPKSRFRKFQFETLEAREMRSVTPNGPAALTAILPDTASTIQVAPAAAAAATAGTSPSSSLLSPSQLRTAYGLPATAASTSNGSGETIAVIEAYNNTALVSNVNAFDQYYGLASLNYQIVNQTTRMEGIDLGWQREGAMDVEWAHAMAPGAKIEIFQAKSGSFDDLMATVDMARNDPNVSVISMSFSEAESVNAASYDFHFTTPNNHQPITFIASAGDNGANSGTDGPQYPDTSPNVLGVGGTTLKQTNGKYGSETVWNGTNGGASHYEPKPSFQSAITLSNNRMMPDVAFDADLNTGVNVYQASASGGNWTNGGGTSLGAPAWAGIIAIANQERNAAGQMSLGHTVADLYSFNSSDFNDITSGSNADYSAKTGYDLVTGLGSPKAQSLIADLVKTEPNQVYKLPGGGNLAAATTGTTTSGNSTVGASSTQSVAPADPFMVDQVFAADGFHAAPQVDSSPASQPLFDFDMMMDASHDNADADQMVDSLFHGRGLGHARN